MRRWCPWCAHAGTCHACQPARVVSVTPCTCQPIAPPLAHGPECPVVADARALGLDPAEDFAPPRLHRVVRSREIALDAQGRELLGPNGKPLWRDAERRVLVPEQVSLVVVVLDTETTGLAATDRVCEIGLARVDLATGYILDERSQLVDPGIPIGAQASRVSGITDADVRGMPTLARIWPSILRWIGDAPILAHNASFDRRLLAQSGAELPNPWHCTKEWAKAAFPACTSYALGELAGRFKLHTSIAHRALGDVRTTVSLAQKLYATAPLPPALKPPTAPATQSLFERAS